MSQSLPTYCEQCGHVWVGQEIGFGENARVAMRGNMTRCPACGQMTPMLDGTFTVQNGTLVLEDGPQITKDKLERIDSALRSLAPDASVEDAEKTLDEAVGEDGFARRIREWIEKHGASALRTSTDFLRLVDMLWRLF